MRWILALVALVIWFFLLVTTSHSMSVATRGKMLFTVIGSLAFAFCLFAGVFLTADCLSEEKREGTLGLLFLTELKGYDVVFGKLIATSLHACYGLLGVLPLLSLPLLIGGVTVGEFWRVTAALVMTLFLSLSVGMLVSALARDTRSVMGLTMLILASLAGLPSAVWALWRQLGSTPPWHSMLLISPGFLYSRGYAAYYTWGRGLNDFSVSFLLLAAFAIGALVVAGAWLPRAWHEKGEKSSGSGRKSARQAWRYVSAASSRGKRWMHANPFLWLANRDLSLRRTALLTFIVLFVIWLCFLPGAASVRTSSQGLCFTVLMFMAFAMHQILKLFIAMESSRRLNEDRRSGALELLLVTPLPVRKILSGQLRSLRNIFRGPIAIVLAINLIMLVFIGVVNPLGMQGEALTMFFEIYGGGALILVLDAHTLSWVGMWMALRKNRHNRAVLATLGRVILPPWLAMFFFFFILQAGRAVSSGEPIVWFGLWFFASFILDLVLVARATQGLSNELRPGLAPSSPTILAAIPQPPPILNPQRP